MTHSGKIDKLVVAVTHRRFCHLSELCMSYMPLSLQAVASITRALNPVVSGYCSIKRLVLARCSLESSGCCRVLESLRGNVFIEEVVLTGNRGGDAMVSAFASICGHDLSKVSNNRSNNCYLISNRATRQLLTLTLTQIRVLGLGDNGLSGAAITLLAPALRGDCHLLALDLHGNALGDDAVDELFRLIRDNNTLSSLNLADTGISLCAWAEQLRVITALASLTLANNGIGDDGLVQLAEVRMLIPQPSPTQPDAMSTPLDNRALRRLFACGASTSQTTSFQVTPPPRSLDQPTDKPTN